MPSLGSPWQRYKAKWENCTLCYLCEVRKNVVLCRGKIPCDVLFIGEAPGLNEDAIGQPFIGPAGKLLDKQIEEALEHCPGMDPRIAFGNLIGCVPKVEGHKISEPPKDCVESCNLRLRGLIELCKPSLIVGVGDVSNKYLSKVIGNVTYGTITHPAAILRAEIVRKDLMYHRVVIILECLFKEL